VVDLRIDGAVPDREIYLDLPLFLRKPVLSSSAGEYVPAEARLILPKDTRAVELSVR
jgi:hypothetical protein